MITPSARLFAFAPVAAPSAQPTGEQTGAGDAAAQRPVDEHFQFHAGSGGEHLLDLFQGRLAFQNHPFDAQIPGEGDPRRVMQPHLSGGMNGQAGEIVPDQPQRAGILHDHSIGAQQFQCRQFFCGVAKFVLLDERIEGDIDFFSVSACVAKQFAHIFMGEIFGPFPGVEAFQARINRVRAGIKCRQSARKIAGGCQQFHILFHHFHSIVFHNMET